MGLKWIIIGNQEDTSFKTQSASALQPTEVHSSGTDSSHLLPNHFHDQWIPALVSPCPDSIADCPIVVTFRGQEP